MKIQFKKTIALFVTLLFCVFILGGCGLVASASSTAAAIGNPIVNKPPAAPSFLPSAPAKIIENERPITSFDKMQYTRPDSEAVAARIKAIQAEIEKTKDFSKVQPLLEEFEALFYNFITMSALADIHTRMDINDAYWQEEDTVLRNGSVAMQGASQSLLRYLYESPLRQEVEGWQSDFFQGMPEIDFVTEVTRPLFQQETDLLQQYSDLLLKGTIVYKGKELSYVEIQQLEYRSYLDAMEAWLTAYNPKLCEVYLEIVQLRDSIAKKLGFENYIEMHFSEDMGGYTPAMVRIFLADLQAEVVPAYLQANSTSVHYLPQVNISFDAFTNMARDVLYDLSPDFLNSWDAMQTYQLYSYQPNAKKEPGASTSYIKNYEAPFILMSYTGDQNSVETFVHEFGHFNDDYTTMWGNPSQMDRAEIFSQALELLFSDYYSAYLGTNKGNEMQHDLFFSSFSTMVYQPYFTAIEMQVYEDPQSLTVDKLNEIAKEEYENFGVRAMYGTDANLYLDWVTNPQVAETPFHTLTYATSIDVALQIWELAQSDKAKAVQLYWKLLQGSANYSFVESVESAGLQSPFGKERTKQAAALIQRYLIGEEEPAAQAA